MAIAYREWTKFYIRTLHSETTGTWGSWNTVAQWSTDHLKYGKVGAHMISQDGMTYFGERWDCVIKPSAADFILEDGMTDPMDYALEAEILYIDKHIHTHPPWTLIAPIWEVYSLSDPDAGEIDWSAINGKYYDGINSWDEYPADRGVGFVAVPLWDWNLNNQELFTYFGTRKNAIFYSDLDYPAGGGAVSWQARKTFFKNGIIFSLTRVGSAAQPNGDNPQTTEYWKYAITPVRLEVRYFNPVVNSLSRYWMEAAGGVPVVLSGLGFNIPTAEISSASRSPFNGPPGEGFWNSYVQDIYFEGLEGQGQYHLVNITDFTINSNNQITIPSMPAMAEGTYHIHLKTFLINDVEDYAWAWAGDWKAASDGRISKAKRIVFRVGKQGFKGTGLLIAGSYAPIDIRIQGVANLIQNGGFSVTTDWSKSAASYPSIASEAGGVSGNCGKITSQATTGAGQYIYEKIGGLVIGDAYHFQAWFKKGTASGGFIKLGTAQGGSQYQSWTGLTDADWKLYALNFIATDGDLYVALGVEEAGKTAFYDEVLLSQGSSFYEGRILDHSPITRSLAESGAAGTISDMDMNLANADRHFSIRLATELLKNQIIQTFCAWKDDSEGNKSTVFSGVIDDYSLAGDVFHLKIRDITQKYFAAKIPRGIATKDEFPNIHSDSDGKPIPIVLGLCSYSAVSANGAITALYVDKTTYKYLLADHAIGVLAIYADGSVVSSSNYSLTHDEYGRTFATFTTDQADKKITFDATGAAYATWNSVNGYIQNPAYIRAYLLNSIIGIPMAFMDIQAFDDMAAYYESIGEEESGYLILQDEKECGEVLAELDKTFGDVGYIAKDGCYTLGRKGISDFAADLNLFAQTDLLAPPEWLYNMPDAVNYIKGRFNWYPAPEVYCQAKKIVYDASVQDFGAQLSSEMELPWTTSPDLVDRRLSEELLKLGYGDRKVSFAVSLDFLDDLDLFTNIRLQDPFGADAGGAGETAHYVYVESMSIDIRNNRIDITARDYQWILRAYLVLGDRDDIAANWSTADESDRMFAYLCNRSTGYFADGQPGKILADRNDF